MRTPQTRQTAAEQPATDAAATERLTALVRALARQAAREFFAEQQAASKPPGGGGHRGD